MDRKCIGVPIIHIVVHVSVDDFNFPSTCCYLYCHKVHPLTPSRVLLLFRKRESDYFVKGNSFAAERRRRGTNSLLSVAVTYEEDLLKEFTCVCLSVCRQCNVRIMSRKKKTLMDERKPRRKLQNIRTWP